MSALVLEPSRSLSEPSPVLHSRPSPARLGYAATLSSPASGRGDIGALRQWMVREREQWMVRGAAQCGFLLALLLWLLPAHALAAKLNLDVDVDRRQVDVGGEISVQVTVMMEGQTDEPTYTPPDFEGLDVVRRGTQRGQSFMMGFGGGPKVTVTTTYSYIVRANVPGKARIGPAKVKAGNELAQSEPITIEVVGKLNPNLGKKGEPPPPAAPNAPPAAPGNTVSGKGDAVMLRVVPDKLDAHVGDQITLSVFLLSRVELSDIQSLTQPQLEGLLLERDDRPRNNLTPRIQRFDGVDYQVFEVARFAVFPLREGPLTIGEFGLDAQGAFSFFSQPRTYHVTSLPVKINAKALPAANKPSPFSSFNVGRFNFSAQLSAETTEVGKPVTLRLVVAGYGNVGKLDLPKPVLGEGVRAFDPETKLEKRFDQAGLNGKLSREYLIVANTPGTHTIAPLVFRYFDPTNAVYREEKTPAFTFTATGEAGKVADAVNAPRFDANRRLAPPRISSTLRDERPSRTKPPWVAASSSLVGLSLVAVALKQARQRLSRSSDTAQKAKGRALRRLRSISRGESRVFYAEVQKVLVDFLNERFAVGIGAQRDKLRTVLSAHGVSEEQIDALLSELDNCDFARFAPGADESSTEQAALQRAEQVINGLDRIPAKKSDRSKGVS